MHILFLSTANLPTNPRLLKEIDLAVAHHRVSVILWKLGNWSDAINEQMMHARPDINFMVLDATRQHFCKWLISAAKERLAGIIWPFLKSNRYLTALASSRRSHELYTAFKRIKATPDLIVAHHNVDTLFPAWKINKKHGIPFIYDAEDYDPGVQIERDAKNERARRESLLKQLLPHATALTSASPLIGDYTLQLIGGHSNHQVVLNSFPANEFKYPTPKSSTLNSQLSTLKLVWFSQKISFGRGLEQLIDALSSLSIQPNNLISLMPNDLTPYRSIELTLIGDLDPAFDRQIITPFTINHSPLTIHHISPLSQPALHAELANHDVGLALEFNSADLNRQLCLTNKIMAYAQAGLYILATDTPAQKHFVEQHSSLGTVCGQDKEGMRKGLISLLEAGKTINEEKQQRFESGKELAWENESRKIEALWKKII